MTNWFIFYHELTKAQKVNYHNMTYKILECHRRYFEAIRHICWSDPAVKNADAVFCLELLSRSAIITCVLKSKFLLILIGFPK